MSYSLAGKKVWVAGGNGMVGSAIIRRLDAENPSDILTVSSRNLDLRNQSATQNWIAKNKPEAVFMAAAKVGGIHANNTYPAQFLYDNLMMAANVIEASWQAGVEKLLFLGSSCIYPKMAPQPISEDSLMTGPLEPTNAAYAMAKISGIYLCETYRREYGADFISAMPTNLYGPGDNYHPENSHVIPGLIRRAHEAKISEAKSLSVWGSGTPRREFLNADDCADALVHVMKNYSDSETINIGSGTDMTIAELATTICKVVGFEGELHFDTSKPDGTPRKLMSGAKLQAMNWSPKINLPDGLSAAYADFKANA
ncbi:GDP-L-fucose synthase family protein [Hellea balneolensis]|uniref:GDP-L-fucose synthase family protein n=1 Tax=Hellea balneolensis TaxID=287478 RepID=UPI0004251E1F|nr:GDP-L-fucose synthase [Hellea balneolensis]